MWGPTHDLDAPVEDIEVRGTQGLFDAARRLGERDSLTPRDIGKMYAQGVLLPQSSARQAMSPTRSRRGSPGERPTGSSSLPRSPRGTFDGFVDYVVPELQRRGLFRTEYTADTLREHLDLSPVTFDDPGAGLITAGK